MSKHTKEPWCAGKKFNTCWYCSNRLDAGHNISGTPHYCGKDLSVFDGEDGRCAGYNPDEDAILYYKTKSLDAQRAEAKEVKQQRDELLTALKDMDRAYMLLLENGRDRILFLGGECDEVPVMESGDPYLRQARAAIAKVKP